MSAGLGARGDGTGGKGGAQRIVAGRYHLISPLGQGGMGVVWRGYDDVLGREVAVKEVRAPGGLEPHEVQRLYDRLEREAWAAARVSHRSVVTVYDVATDEGRPWIVMELVRGMSFADVLDAEGPLPPARAAQVGAEVLAALRGAHEAGVLHRDVKPGNILVADDGRVVLTDFGIAVIEGGSQLTMTGELIGSPEFLAPERALGRTPGPASDLWSLGVTLYAAVEGFSPFRQDTPLSTMRAVVDEQLPPATRAGALTSVLEGMLVKDPDQRMSIDDALRQLRLVAAGGTPRTPTEVVPPGFGPPQTSGLPTGPPPGTAFRSEGWDGSGTRTAPMGAVGGPTGTLPPVTDTTTATEAGRPRHSGAVLIAGLIALALAGGGLAYALSNGGGDDGGTNSESGTGGGSGGKGQGGSGGTGGGGGDSPSPGHSSSPSKSYQAPQSVRVSVSAGRAAYKGSCPPSAGNAPYFTGTITVGRVPVDVRYRWVTGSGHTSDGGWKTLSFTSSGGKSKQVNHTETGYVANGTRRDWIALQVSSPKQVESNHVSFTLTCETSSPSPSGSYGAGSDASS